MMTAGYLPGFRYKIHHNIHLIDTNQTAGAQICPPSALRIQPNPIQAFGCIQACLPQSSPGARKRKPGGGVRPKGEDFCLSSDSKSIVFLLQACSWNGLRTVEFHGAARSPNLSVLWEKGNGVYTPRRKTSKTSYVRIFWVTRSYI
jgi:hypothetical protein